MSRSGRTIGALSLVNLGVTGLAFVTGPLQARALGPEGRGLLAAILIPVTLAPQIAGLGLGVFATRESARGRPVPVLLGTLGAPLLALSLVSILASGLLANLVAGDRAVVHTYVQLGFVLLPFGLFATLLVDLSVGLQRWRLLIAGRLVSPIIWTAGVVVLYATGHLTVAAAAIVTLVGGAAGFLPFLPLLKAGRPHFDTALLRQGVPFGLKTWIGGLSALANVRLDQLLMVRLVSEKELGLYVVAVTVAMFTASILLGAITMYVSPRIAGGDSALAARACRLTLAVMLGLAAGMAVVTPILLRLAFGAAFTPATTMVRILLAASVPYAAAFVLSTALVQSGHPGKAARVDLFAVVLTVVGLLVLLPRLGAVGAAYVSLASYSASFVLLLRWARRDLDVPLRDLLVPTWRDLASLRAELALLRSKRGKVAVAGP